MAIKIQLRRDLAQNWATQNPILAQGEVGWEIGTSNYKIGDGVTAWNSLNYIPLGGTINNGKLTIKKNGTTIAEFTANQSNDTVANIIADSATFANITGEVSDNEALVAEFATKQDVISDLDDIRDGAELGATALQSSDVINNTTSTATNKPLSANQGRELQEQITNLERRLKYLTDWNCVSGQPTTNPPYNPYPYTSGDFFVVSIVAQAGGTNYKPSGTSYTIGQPASTVVETEAVEPNDIYIYDGTSWTLRKSSPELVASFATLSGDPSDNAKLANALDGKYDASNPQGFISEVPVATTSNLGAVQPDGTTITITNAGVISAVGGGGGASSFAELQGQPTDNANLATALNNKYDASNPNGYITGITSSDVQTALGYTPYSSANPQGYQTNVLEGVKVDNTDLTIGVDKKVNISTVNMRVTFSDDTATTYKILE